MDKKFFNVKILKEDFTSSGLFTVQACWIPQANQKC